MSGSGWVPVAASMHTPVDRAVLAHARGIDATVRGDLPVAISCAQRAVELLSDGSGEHRADTANALLALAFALERSGRFGEALTVAQRAVGELEPIARCGVRAVAELRVEALVSQASLLRMTGAIAESVETAVAAVAVAETELGGGNLATAAALNACGICFKAAGNLAAAQDAYERAWGIIEQQGCPPDLAACVLHDLGGLEHERGRPDAGIPWAERGLAVRRSDPGAALFDIASDLAALGSLYELDGRVADAEDALMDALVIFQSSLGADHYEVGAVCGNLAVVVARRGRTHEALRLFERGLEIKRSVLGPDHPDLAPTMNNFGVLLCETGRRGEGFALINSAERILAATFAADHPRLIAVRAARTEMAAR